MSMRDIWNQKLFWHIGGSDWNVGLFPSDMGNVALFIECRLVFTGHRALLTLWWLELEWLSTNAARRILKVRSICMYMHMYRALMIELGALLQEIRALVIEFRALWIVYRAFWTPCRRWLEWPSANGKQNVTNVFPSVCACVCTGLFW